MNLQEIEKHAKALMTAHGVGSLRFEFDGGKRRLGATHFRRVGNTVLAEKITLSRHYAVLLPDDELHDVILHEIAHALAGRDAHHGPVWRSAARKIGAKAQRCATPSASPEHTVEGRCIPCGVVVSKGFRLPTNLYIHSACKRDLTYFRRGVRVDLNDMPVKYQQRHMWAVERGRI